MRPFPTTPPAANIGWLQPLTLTDDPLVAFDFDILSAIRASGLMGPVVNAFSRHLEETGSVGRDPRVPLKNRRFPTFQRNHERALAQVDEMQALNSRSIASSLPSTVMPKSASGHWFDGQSPTVSYRHCFMKTQCSGQPVQRPGLSENDYCHLARLLGLQLPLALANGCKLSLLRIYRIA